MLRLVRGAIAAAPLLAAGCVGGVPSVVTAADVPAAPAGVIGGVSAIELAIGRSGRALSCIVQLSSGSSLLDERACNLHLERHREAPASEPPERYVQRRVDWGQISGSAAPLAVPLSREAIVAAIGAGGGRCIDLDLGRACLGPDGPVSVDITPKLGETAFLGRIRERLGHACARLGEPVVGWRSGRDVAIFDGRTLYLATVTASAPARTVDMLCPPLPGNS